MKRDWLDSWIYVLTIAIMFNDDLNDEAKDWARERKAQGKTFKMRDFILRHMPRLFSHPNLAELRTQYYAEKSARDDF